MGLADAPGPRPLGQTGVGLAVFDRAVLARKEDRPTAAQDQCGLGAADDQAGPALAAAAAAGVSGRWRLCRRVAGSGLCHKPGRDGLALALGCRSVPPAGSPAPWQTRPQALERRTPAPLAGLGRSLGYPLGDDRRELVWRPAQNARDAIVIYRVPTTEGLRVRGRLRELKKRLDYVKARAAGQEPIQAKLFESYQKAGAKRLPGKQQLAVSAIGASTLPVAMVEITRKTLPALAAQPDVVAVLPNQKIQLIRPKQVNYSELIRREIKDGLTWGLKQLDIPRLWKTTKGEHINVAVLDTGVHGEHPALGGRVKDFVVIDPLGRRITANPTFDSGQHGTHVCGTIAGGKTPDGVTIGVAPEANLFVAGVLIGDATLRTLLEGISWAVEKGADIINMSLGFSYYEPLFDEVFNTLIDQYDILPVVAIGNENHGNSSSPGNAPNAFAVGAVEKMSRGKLEVAFFSSGASLVFPGEEPNALVTKPDVVAPGVQIFSCIPPEKRPDGTYEYAYMDGTSMTTPHVAGVAALLMAAKPDAPVTAIINALKETAKHPKGAQYRPDNRWGYGLIQPVEALKAIG
ncbi:MAG: S8 family serine peptidase [candidate division NC10 bacterium]|nr:S8 family serine peptidase [candidate division NC10 bacterium]